MDNALDHVLHDPDWSYRHDNKPKLQKHSLSFQFSRVRCSDWQKSVPHTHGLAAEGQIVYTYYKISNA